MVEKDALAQKVFSLLKGNGLQIKIFDIDGNETTDPTAGRRFFVSNPNLMITIDENDNFIELSKGPTAKEISKIQDGVRRLANEFMMNFDLKVFGKSIQPRDYSYQAKNSSIMEHEVSEKGLKTMTTITENSLLCPKCHSMNVKHFSDDEKECQDCGKSWDHAWHNMTKDEQEKNPMKHPTNIHYVKESFSKMFGSKKTSRQVIENVKILVRHKQPVDENIRGARSRSISAIFLECNGERFRFPHNSLSGARAMAQHLAHGGHMSDKVGTYITENTGNLLKLQSFNRYVTTNRLINEDSSGIVDTIKENIETIRAELRKLTGIKTYETVKARIETFEREQLSEDDTTALKELFTIRRFDEKFEEVLPIVKQLVQERDTYHKRLEEAASQTILIKKELLNTPVFEFASDQSKLGYKLNELSLRIVENEELAGFVNKIGTKLCKEGQINNFEKAILEQVLNNLQVINTSTESKKLKESLDLEDYFNSFDSTFI